MKWIYRFQFLVCALLFGLIILGAGVRLADAGLSCPDWPLCFDQAVPTFNTQIFLEWIHRVIAATVGLIALALTISFFVLRSTPASVKKLSILSLILFAVQAFLGRQTVIQLLRSEIVASHLIGGYLLFAANVLILSRLSLKKAKLIQLSKSYSIAKIFFSVFLAIAFFQAVLGGIVSSHYAGMVCPDFPTCHGSWWPGFSGLIGIQYAHRLTAFTILFGVFIFGIAIIRRKPNERIQKLIYLLMCFISLQILLGASMIFQQVHPALSLAHSATSLSIFTTLLLGTIYVWDRKIS